MTRPGILAHTSGMALWGAEGVVEGPMITQAIRASGSGAKATQYGLLGTTSGCWALLELIGKTWLPFLRLSWLIWHDRVMRCPEGAHMPKVVASAVAQSIKDLYLYACVCCFEICSPSRKVVANNKSRDRNNSGNNNSRICVCIYIYISKFIAVSACMPRLLQGSAV